MIHFWMVLGFHGSIASEAIVGFDLCVVGYTTCMPGASLLCDVGRICSVSINLLTVDLMCTTLTVTISTLFSENTLFT